MERRVGRLSPRAFIPVWLGKPRWLTVFGLALGAIAALALCVSYSMRPPL
jgi:hypothetical protein